MCEWACLHPGRLVWGGLGWFGGGLGLRWQVYVIQMLLNSFFKSSYYHKKHVWWWFGVNMAGLRNIRNTNAFKFILQVFILSQKHIMGVK